MNRFLHIVFAFMVLAGTQSAQSAQVSDMAPCAPNAEHEVRTLQGFIKVHVDCSNVLLEIPPSMLNKSMLFYIEFSALSTGGSEYAPGSAIDSRVVRWVRYGSKIALQITRYDNWAGDSSALQQGIDAVSLPTVIEVFDIIREGADKAPIIDITSLFTTHVPRGFALEFMRHYRMARVDGGRSLVRNVRVFPKNIAIGFYQTWTPDEADLLKPDKDQEPPPATLGFSFKANLLLLPDKPMTGRCEDERVGYFTSPFNDYSTD